MTEEAEASIHNQLLRMSERLEKERHAKTARAAGILVSVLAIAGTIGGGVWRLGEVSAQQQQTRSDVAQVLVVVQRLDRDAETVRARLDEGARADTDLRGSIRDLDQRIWAARPVASARRQQENVSDVNQ